MSGHSLPAPLDCDASNTPRSETPAPLFHRVRISPEIGFDVNANMQNSIE